MPGRPLADVADHAATVLPVAGFVAGSLLYSMHVVIFAATVYSLMRRQCSRLVRTVNLVFVCTMAGLGTLAFVSGFMLNIKAFIDNKDFPSFQGLPAGAMSWFHAEGYAEPVDLLFLVAMFGTQVLSESLLLFRAWVLWNRSYALIAMPAIMLLLLTATGIVTRPPHADMSPDLHYNMTLLYFMGDMALTLFLSAAIILRLLLNARRIRSVLGAQYGGIYICTTRIIVESMAPCTLMQIVLAVSDINAVGTDNVGAGLWLFGVECLPQMLAIAPNLIILLVAHGRALPETSVSSSSAAVSDQPPEASDPGAWATTMARCSPHILSHVRGTGTSIRVADPELALSLEKS